MWKSVFKELPMNGQTVWIRVLSVYGQLTLAEFVEVDQTFIVAGTGVTIPVYFIGRWKAQN